MNDFEIQLERGLAGEGRISRWLIGRGFSVLPAYEIETSHGKGPRLFTAQGQLISPDLLAFKEGKILWFEAKTKTAFTWYRKSATWQTGIDLRHWRDYLGVDFITPFPIWLLFLHQPNGCAKDTPEGMKSPSGLFGEEIGKLNSCVDHESEKHGPSGMVYWRHDSLKKLAKIEDL